MIVGFTDRVRMMNVFQKTLKSHYIHRGKESLFSTDLRNNVALFGIFHVAQEYVPDSFLFPPLRPVHHQNLCAGTVPDDVSIGVRRDFGKN